MDSGISKQNLHTVLGQLPRPHLLRMFTKPQHFIVNYKSEWLGTAGEKGTWPTSAKLYIQNQALSS